MSCSLITVPAALSLIVAVSPVVAQDDDLRAEVTRMARIGSVSSPSFSPDGRTIAFISNKSGIPQIYTLSEIGAEPDQITDLEDPVGSVAWSPMDNLLAFSVAPGGGMNEQIYVIAPDGTQMRRMTDGADDNNWIGDWVPGGRFISFASNRRNPARMDAWLVDTRAAFKIFVAGNPGVGYMSSFNRDSSRGILNRVTSRGDNNLFLLNIKDRVETLLTPHEGPGRYEGAIAPDGRTVYLSTTTDRDRAAFGRVEISENFSMLSAEPLTILAARDDAELGSFVLNDQGTHVALIWNVAGRSELEFLTLKTGGHPSGDNVAVEDIVRSPVSDLPGEIIGQLVFSRNGTTLGLSISGSTMPSDLWTMDLRTSDFDLRKITSSPHEGVDLESLITPELVSFKAHDGLDLSGWLYLPRDFARPGPVVLSFHGGPEGQSRPRFNSTFQALLARGIAVFDPNVRGSSGFGKKFVNLDNGALRANGVKDIESCVKYIVDAGIGQPGKLGIMGGSYGGYMVMAGLTEYPDMFAAGANLFGVVNFKTFFEQTQPWMAAISKVEYGDPATQAHMLRDLSPIHKVDQVKAPTLVLHGANDTNVPVVEAEQVVENLKSRGVPCEYVLFPDEGHGWRKTKNRITSTVAIVEWFEKYLK